MMVHQHTYKGFNGVSKNGNKFVAKISINGKQKISWQVHQSKRCCHGV